MSAQTEKDSDFTCEVIKILRSQPLDAKNRIDLRIVKWNRATTAVLEKRRVWLRADGERPTKAVGLDSSDIKFIYENYAEIVNML
jgi:hypothetical protein